MQHPTESARAKVVNHLNLGEAESALIDRVAREQFQGNRSMAARHIITHFANCVRVSFETRPDAVAGYEPCGE